jgi:hypothetical protein
MEMQTQIFFYLRANDRKNKKHIQVIRTIEGLAIRQEDKEQEVARHFGDLLGKKNHRTISLNWGELNYPSNNLVDLEVDITGEEVKKGVFDMPKENAPRPDGFIGAFYCTCWVMIHNSVTQAVRQLAHVRGKTSTSSTQQTLFSS